MIDLLFNFIDLFHDSYTFRVLGESVTLFRSILPGLVIGLLVSSFLVACRPMKRMAEWPRINGIGAVALMSLMGVVSPFCSYLAIPLAAGLIAAGVSPAPVVAFLCATPLMNPTLFAMTWSAFGWPMATARVVSALGLGIMGGMLGGRFADRLVPLIQKRSTSTERLLQSQEPEIAFIRRWRKSCFHLGKFVLKYVLLGILIAAVMKEVIPIRWVEAVVGREHGYGILVGALLGVPLYACGGGTIPLIQVLMQMGMSPGAALAFFIAGPATTLSTLAAMQMTMGVPVTGVYVFISILWSILSGMMFQLIS